MSGLGLIPAQQTMSNVVYERFLRSNQPIVAPTLVSPVAIQGNASEGGLAVPAEIEVPGTTHATPAYVGAIKLVPGGNTFAPGGSNGVVIRADTGPSTIVEIGTDGEGPNELLIAGADGLAEVYNTLYNQPVALRAITQVQTAPLLTPDNDEEILRCVQAGIAQAIAFPGTQFNVFAVPRTGAYTIQTEITVGNSTPTNSVVIPSTIVAGVPVWKSISLSFQVQGTVQSVPYASFEVIGGDFYGEQAFAGNSIITKTYTSVAFLTAGTNYAITLNCDSGWNIGSGGQIKTELIAMC
jgi:hypothetical protein